MMTTSGLHLSFRWLLMPLLLQGVVLIPARAWADPPPHQEWTRLFGTINDDYPTSVAVSRSGQVYAVGYLTPENGGRNIFIQKINNCAIREWCQQWGGDYVSGVAVDDCGFVSIAYKDNTPSFRARIRRLDWCGRCYWDLGFPDLGTSNTGSVATWRSHSYVAVQSNAGVHVVKMAPGGNRSWVATLNRGDGFSSVTELAVDNAGNAYLTGTSAKTSTGQPAPGFNDIFLAKFDPSGRKCWHRIWGTVGNDKPLDLVLDKYGNAIVGTIVNNVAQYSLLVFDANGNQRSDTTIDQTHFGGTAFDLSGRLYRNDTRSVSRYSFEPTTATWTKDTWKWTFPAGTHGTLKVIRRVASDPQGNIYLVGYTNGEFFAQPRIGGIDGFVVKLIPTN